jgi:excinuclease ABC subunit A
MVDQNPIGRSSRSNPVTYVKAWDEIRTLLASQPAAKAAGLKPSVFSFNVEGGRCDVCQGDGEVKVEMQFMADLFLPCEACDGKRFKQHVLDINYRDKNVSEILGMDVDEALAFFADEPKIVARLQPLVDVGLGYVHLGQSSNTLSGGEAQRIKLASFLVKGNQSKQTLFIFDEPTNFLDRESTNALSDAIKSFKGGVLVISHNDDFYNAITREKWLLENGSMTIFGDNLIEALEKERKRQEKENSRKLKLDGEEEKFDSLGNKIEAAPKEQKELTRDEKKKLLKQKKELEKAGQDTYEIDVLLGLA